MQDLSTALSLLKIALGVTHTARDAYYTAMLTSCLSSLEDRGVILDMTETDDTMLLVDYAEFSYRSRDAKTDMPEHLKYRLRNREVQGRANS